MFNQNYCKLALIKIPQRYLLVNVLAKRIRQLQRGGDTLLEGEEVDSIAKMDIALKEIAEGKIFIKKMEEGKKEG
ncbi:MAG: DNA-directed RNA polymerase subunit omega [Nitrospinae bacterium]|nr:DNA-directed RNA polymerase subunit omega [Nitrospinota bacterium]